MTEPMTQVQHYAFNVDSATEERWHSTQLLQEEGGVALPAPDASGQINHWLNVDGVHDEALIRKIGKHYELHHLLIEDILNANQRPKLEEYDNALTVTTQILSWEEGELATEQLTLVLCKGILLTFQEFETWAKLFDPIRTRILEGKGRTRKGSVDYLMYSILDVLVDHNLWISERLEEEAEKLEEKLLLNDEPTLLSEIYKLRMQVTALRQKSRPTREMLRQLLEGEYKLVDKRTALYVRDVHDHALRIADRIEALREMLNGMSDLHMSQANNRMSEIMKFLTMISAIFVPLNLIAAVYGMNFTYMPELKIKGMYFVALGVMGGIAGGMIYLFKKKDWI